MSTSLVILGAGGWFPAHGRHTACTLLRDDKRAIMIDAGTGVGRLVERPELLEGVERLDIVLTHFHLDHVAGLAYLPAVGHCRETVVWGPGKALYETATRGLLGHLSHEPFHPVPLEDQDVEVRDLPPRELELGLAPLQMRVQRRHSAPTLGLRFGDTLAWITDTAHDAESSSFAAGCTLLAHEAWFTRAAPRGEEIHSSAADAVAVADAAGIERLLLTHLPPFSARLDDLEEEARQAGMTGVVVPRDNEDASALLR